MTVALHLTLVGDQAFHLGRGAYEAAQGPNPGWTPFASLPAYLQAHWVAQAAMTEMRQVNEEERKAIVSAWNSLPTNVRTQPELTPLYAAMGCTNLAQDVLNPLKENELCP